MRPTIPAAACLTLFAFAAQARDETPPPTKTVTAYLKHLGAGRPQTAIEECIDVREMDRRLFGEAAGALDPSRAAYLEQLTSVALKAAASLMPMDKVLAKAKRTPFQVKIDGEEARVTCTLAFEVPSTPGGVSARPDTIHHELSMVLKRHDDGWKIVDVEPVLATWKATYAPLSSEGMGPVEYMERITATLLEEKASPGSLERNIQENERGLREAQFGNVRTQLDTLANQIELFKAREQRYPDFAHRGWEQLIKGGYLTRAPLNPINGHSEVCIGSKENADFGWYWDEKAGTLNAYGYHGEDPAPMAEPTGTPRERYMEYAARAKASSCKGTLGALRSGVANFYANSALDGQAKWPTLKQVQTPGKQGVMLEKLPANPYNGDARVMPATWDESGPIAGTHGWNYDAKAGKFWANTNAVGENEW